MTIFFKKNIEHNKCFFLTIKKKIASDTEPWIISTFHLAHQVCKVDMCNIT